MSDLREKVAQANAEVRFRREQYNGNIGRSEVFSENWIASIDYEQADAALAVMEKEAALQKMADMGQAWDAAPSAPTVQEAARQALKAYDDFMAGEAESELTRAVSTAACFGAAAYETGTGGQGAHALARSFLIALIDPADAQLDYLRADPSAGQTARGAVTSLRALAGGEG